MVLVISLNQKESGELAQALGDHLAALRQERIPGRASTTAQVMHKVFCAQREAARRPR